MVSLKAWLQNQRRKQICGQHYITITISVNNITISSMSSVMNIAIRDILTVCLPRRVSRRKMT